MREIVSETARPIAAHDLHRYRIDSSTSRGWHSAIDPVPPHTPFANLYVAVRRDIVLARSTEEADGQPVRRTVRRRETRMTRAAPCFVLLLTCSASLACLPGAAAIDARVRAAMAETGAKGMAIAVIDDGRVAYVQAYGARNSKGDPLQTDTVMYGASLTKTVMAYTALTLVDQGKLTLDAPLAGYLERPLISYGEGQTHLAKYGPYRDLAGDERWRTITARMALTHSTGFHNFWFIEPEQKLRIHFDPGSRYSYSGEGFSLLQFVIENGRRNEGLGLDLGALTQANFDRLGMTRTSLVWRPDFRPNLADGFNDKGEAIAHDERSKVRVAGSMDTTIADLSKFVAALTRREGLSSASYAEMLKPQLHIGTATQFPSLGPEIGRASCRERV